MNSKICPPDAIAHLAEPEAGSARARSAGSDPGPAYGKNLCRVAGPEDRAICSKCRPQAQARDGFRTGWRGRGILKTRRLGYDGKGQAKVTSADETRCSAFESFKAAPAILEGFVDFAFEASVVAARGAGRHIRGL